MAHGYETRIIHGSIILACNLHGNDLLMLQHYLTEHMTNPIVVLRVLPKKASYEYVLLLICFCSILQNLHKSTFNAISLSSSCPQCGGLTACK